MRTPEEKRKIAEAHINDRINAKIPREIGTADVSYLLLLEMKALMEQLIDLQLEKAGKEVFARDNELPTPVTKKGRRTWLWPKRK